MNYEFCMLLIYDWELHSYVKFRNKNASCAVLHSGHVADTVRAGLYGTGCSGTHP